MPRKNLARRFDRASASPGPCSTSKLDTFRKKWKTTSCCPPTTLRPRSRSERTPGAKPMHQLKVHWHNCPSVTPSLCAASSSGTSTTSWSSTSRTSAPEAKKLGRVHQPVRRESPSRCRIATRSLGSGPVQQGGTSMVPLFFAATPASTARPCPQRQSVSSRTFPASGG